MQILSDLLTQTMAEQSAMARAAAATASLLKGDLLNTVSSLSQSALGRLTTQLVEDGYKDLLLADVLVDLTACLRHAASNPKTLFKVFQYTTPPNTANTTELASSR